MKLLLTLCLLFFLFFKAEAQINKLGIPFIKNYSPKEYIDGEQNWCVTQDYRGIMYFGNNNILEFDGTNWRKIPVTNNSIIRSLAVDQNGTIYIGAVGDFGCMVPAIKGELSYNSFLPLLDSADFDFSDVWKTYVLNDHVYFCTYNKIFDYSKKSIRVIKLGKTNKFTFLIDSTLYNEDFFVGLMELEEDSLKMIPEGNYFKNKDIFYMGKYGENQILIGTIFNGLTLYNLKNKSLNTEFFSKKLNGLLSNGYLYNGAQVNENHFAIATLQNGMVNINKQGEIENHITSGNGLQDNIVTSVFSNKNAENITWLTLNSGNSKIEINSPIMQFSELQGIDAAINDIIRYNNELYICTDLGVHYLNYDKDGNPIFTKIQGLSDQSWSFLRFEYANKSMLLVATSVGIFEISDHFARQLIFNENGNNNYYCFKLFQDTERKDILFIGHSKGCLMAQFLNSKWQKVNEFPEISDEIRFIQKAQNGDFWFSTYFNGLIRVSNIYSADYKINKYKKESGLSSLSDINIINYKNRLYFATASGLFNFDSISNQFSRDSLFGLEYASGQKSIFRYQYNPQDDKITFSVNRKNIHSIIQFRNEKGNLIIDSLPFKRLPNEQFDAIYHDTDGITWLGSSSGLYSYNPNVKVDYYKPYHTLVRKVTTVNDSVLFWGTNYTTDSTGNRTVALEQPAELIPILDYKFNDLTFEYAAPYFIEEKKTEYSYLLDGYKENWSKWSTEPKAVFTNLHEGKYIFEVKAKNIYGIESSVAEYRFSILPPWYRTYLAYIIYIILGIISIVIIVKLYTRKLQLEKIRLEVIVMERTVEIRMQKEEIESQAEKLKEANEVLTEQKEEITKQKEEITSSIKYAKRIQQAIVPSTEKATELLHDYFLLWRPRDIVSGDFWWLGEKEGYIVVAAADCTGHGVPGAFMSMLGVSFLNEIVNQQESTQSHEILNKLRTKVKLTLGQTGKEGEAKDGMDIALAVIDFNSMTLQFSGAYNPLYLYRSGQLEVYKADRNPIGIYIKEKESFTQNIIQLQKGDTFYLFSDGIVDQFGGPDKMKFGSNRLKETLDSIQTLTMTEQREKLNDAIENWRGDTEQIDDIIVLGVRI